MCLGEDLLCAGRVERQVAGHEFQRVARSPQPRQMRLLGTTRRHQLRTHRDTRDHHAQHVVTGRRPEFVKVVQHQHERNRTGPERGREAWRGAAQRRYANTAHVSDQMGLTRDPRVRRRQHRQQGRRIIVVAVESHPPDVSIFHVGPLSQQGRLAVTRGRGDTDHAAVARASSSDEPGATHRRAKIRHRELRVEQRRFELDNARRSPIPANGHSR